jgi:hypothetical protein
MNLTIIPSDNAIYKNGIMRANLPLPLDLTLCNIPANVHALQWKETAGWIEFEDNPDGTKPENEPITELPAWALACVGVYDAWTPYVPPQLDQPSTSGTQSA